jgi:thiol-disulfide isomerase/thioredoxin
MTPRLVSRIFRRCLLPMLLVFNAPAVDAGESLEKAPAFVLLDVNSNEHRLSDYAGKVLVVNFWASWCVPCREELPSMNRAAKKLAELPVAWIAVNVGEDREAVAAFRADYPIDFSVLLDATGEVSRSWRVTGMPTTYIIDPRGYLVHRIVGKREWDDERHLQMLTEQIGD